MGADGKRCSVCGEWKLYEEYHRNHSAKDGLQHLCKECAREYAKQYRRRNSAKVKARHQRYYQEHKKDIDEKNRQWVETHREEWATYQKAYREEHREEIAIYSRQWREENKEHVIRYREDYKETAKVLRRLRDEQNRDKKRVYDQRHRARKANLPGDFTGDEWLVLCNEYDVCPCCKKPWAECGSPTIDHVIPVSWPGASNDIDALQPLCVKCNSAKGNRHATDYRNNTSIKERQ